MENQRVFKQGHRRGYNMRSGMEIEFCRKNTEIKMKKFS